MLLNVASQAWLKRKVLTKTLYMSQIYFFGCWYCNLLRIYNRKTFFLCSLVFIFVKFVRRWWCWCTWNDNSVMMMWLLRLKWWYWWCDNNGDDDHEDDVMVTIMMIITVMWCSCRWEEDDDSGEEYMAMVRKHHEKSWISLYSTSKLSHNSTDTCIIRGFPTRC
jgi:hypothetical protein